MRAPSLPLLRDTRGFTLLEIIAVLVVLGVAAAVAFASSSGLDLGVAAQADAVKVHLRYAQTRAMQADEVWGIAFGEGGTYALFRDGDPARTVALPGETSATVTLPRGVTVSPGVVAFDGWGRPYTDGPATTRQSGARQLVVRSAGGEQATITITPNTGFIP